MASVRADKPFLMGGPPTKKSAFVTGDVVAQAQQVKPQFPFGGIQTSLVAGTMTCLIWICYTSVFKSCLFTQRSYCVSE